MDYFNLDEFSTSYCKSVSSKSEPEQIIESAKLFEDIVSTLISMYVHPNLDRGYHDNLKLLEYFGEPENSLHLYVINKDFLHEFRRYRNKIIHSKGEVSGEKMEMSIIREKLYVHIGVFLSEDLGLKIPEDLQKYDHPKPEKLAEFLKRIRPRRILYSKKDGNSRVTEAPNPSSNPVASPYDSEPSIKKSERVFLKTLLGVVSLAVLLLFGFYFFNPKAQNAMPSSESSKISDSVEKDNSPLSTSEKNDNIIEMVSEKKDTSSAPKTQPLTHKENPVQGNQINFGDGNKIENSNISGGDVNLDSKK